MVRIVPAILEKKLADIEARLSAVRGEARLVQIDLVDGVFAPNRTWPYTDGGRAEFEAIAAQERGFPHWEDFDFQFDLMLAHPEQEVQGLLQAGASALVVHASSDGAFMCLRELKKMRDGGYPVSSGIALASNAAAGDLERFAGLFDFVQVMGIARAGFQGEPFDERSLALVAAVRAAHPDMPIQVDGAVTRAHVRTLVDAGATSLVVGHDIREAPEPKKEYQALYTEANVERS